jgi:hypothetical protein
MSIPPSNPDFKGLSEKQSTKLALDYIARHPGRYIFPIKPGAKFPPLLKRNLEDASNDPAHLTAWAKKWPGANWGVAHAKSHLLVVDIDTKADKEGEKTFDLLDLDYGFPETEENRTPSGGRHLVYEGEHVFALGENGFGADVDSPNYSLIAGCKLRDGAAYEAINNLPAAPAPQWFYEVLSAAKNKTRLAEAGDAAVDLDKPENVSWAVDFLKVDAEPAIEGQSGDHQTLKIAMGLRDRGISEPKAFELMAEHYNERCSPPWEADDLRRKVANAYAYASQSQLGGKTAEADFADEDTEIADRIQTHGDPKRIEAETRERELAREREAKVRSGPIWTKQDVLDAFVYITDIDRFVRIDKPNVMWKRVSFDAHFKYLARGKFSDQLFSMTKGTIRRFETSAYAPGEDVSLEGGTICNLYRPPNVVPKAGDTAWFESHVSYLFPDEEQRRHLYNWLAWFIQNPKRKPKHALLIQGREQGTGKSFLGEVLAKVIGEHNRAVVSQTVLGSDFNGYARRTKLITIEELRAVDRMKVKNALHELVTQDMIAVNEKNLPVIEVRNCFGVVAYTNDEAALKLEDGERRYLVLRTDAEPKGPSYYSQLFRYLDDPEAIAAVAYLLQNWDYGAYNGAGKAPLTIAKAEMIEAGRTDLEDWLISDRAGGVLSHRIVRIESIEDAMPRDIAVGRIGKSVRSTIGAVLRKHFDGVPTRLRLPDHPQRRVWLINGQKELRNHQMAKIYYEDLRLIETGRLAGLPPPSGEDLSDIGV